MHVGMPFYAFIWWVLMLFACLLHCVQAAADALVITMCLAHLAVFLGRLGTHVWGLRKDFVPPWRAPPSKRDQLLSRPSVRDLLISAHQDLQRSFRHVSQQPQPQPQQHVQPQHTLYENPMFSTEPPVPRGLGLALPLRGARPVAEGREDSTVGTAQQGIAQLNQAAAVRATAHPRPQPASAALDRESALVSPYALPLAPRRRRVGPTRGPSKLSRVGVSGVAAAPAEQLSGNDDSSKSNTQAAGDSQEELIAAFQTSMRRDAVSFTGVADLLPSHPFASGEVLAAAAALDTEEDDEQPAAHQRGSTGSLSEQPQPAGPDMPQYRAGLSVSLSSVDTPPSVFDTLSFTKPHATRQQHKQTVTDIHHPTPTHNRVSWATLIVDGTVSALMLAAVVRLLTLSNETSLLPAAAVYRIYDADNTAPARAFMPVGQGSDSEGQPGPGKPGRWTLVTPPDYQPLLDFAAFLTQLNDLADNQVRMRSGATTACYVEAATCLLAVVQGRQSERALCLHPACRLSTVCCSA